MKDKKIKILDTTTLSCMIYSILENILKIKKEHVLSPKKGRLLADSRRACVAILKENYPKMIQDDIGEIVGRKHSNVSIQHKEHFNLYNSNKQYTDTYNIINKEFRNLLDKRKTLDELYYEKKQIEDKLIRLNESISEYERNIRNEKYIINVEI